MDNVTKQIIMSRLTAIANELAQIEQLLISEVPSKTEYSPGSKPTIENIKPVWGPKGESIPDGRNLDVKYPCPNEEGYREFLDELNNENWDINSAKDYRRYHWLKGAITNHLKAYNKTSVPLKNPEPEWDIPKNN